MAGRQKLEPLPFYKWHVRDYRANRKVQRMSWQAKGLYRELLDEYWDVGSLPDDEAHLADICNCSVEVLREWWPQIVGCWDLREGFLTNRKMDAQRTEEDALRVASKIDGRKGGLKKAENALNRLASLDDAKKSTTPPIYTSSVGSEVARGGRDVRGEAKNLRGGSETSSHPKELLARREEKRRVEESKEEKSREDQLAQFQNATPRAGEGLSKAERLDEGEGLKDLQSQEQFTAKREEDEKESSASCRKSDNCPTLLHENQLGLVQGEIPGAGLRPESQQARVEPPTRGEVAENRPDGWMEWPAELHEDEAIEALMAMHPRPLGGAYARVAALDEIEWLTKKRGKGRYDAYLFLCDRFKAFKAATSTWGKADKQFIQGMLNFLTERTYLHDEDTWGRNDGVEEQAAAQRHTLLLDALKAGSDQGIDPRPLRGPRPEDIRAERLALRNGTRSRF